MENIYMIKELCPMWNDGTGVDYKVIKPYVFLKQKEAEECRLDYEYISGDRVLCTEYELIKLEVEDDLEKIKEINVKGEVIKIRSIIDNNYEDDFRYDIHSWDQLESAGRINNVDIDECDDKLDDIKFESYMERDYLYSGSDFF